MERLSQFVLNADRRIIYAVIALCVIGPLLFPLGLPFTPTTEVKKCFEDIEKLPPGSAIVIGTDYGPDSAPETQPMLVALLHQCFQKKLRPILIALTPAGDQMAQLGLKDVLATEDPQTKQPVYQGLENGKDYSLLGYQSGTQAIILALTSSFTKTYPNDKDGNPTANQPIFQDIRKLSDVKYIVDIAAVAMPEVWLVYGSARVGVPMSTSCTAVSAAQYYPYYHAGQFHGLIGGMKGSAEYEKLVGVATITGKIPNATKGMDSQSLVHIFLVLTIIVVNLVYLLDRRRQRAGGRAA
jgi:hypothetical protein